MKELDLDDIAANPGAGESFDSVVARVAARRRFLKSGSGAGALGFLGLGAGLPAAAQAASAKAATPCARGFAQSGFYPCEGRHRGRYRVAARLCASGSSIAGRSFVHVLARFKGDASDGADAQAQQIGYNHDGMHFFPIDASGGQVGRSSTEGLLVTKS